MITTKDVSTIVAFSGLVVVAAPLVGADLAKTSEAAGVAGIAFGALLLGWRVYIAWKGPANTQADEILDAVEDTVIDAGKVVKK
jgi:hypothetical protein